MRPHESLKRATILLLSLIGLILQTAVYGYLWYNIYFPYISYRLPFWQKGHWLLILLYFALLTLFSQTYGGTKIGYLKGTDVFFSQFFALLCVNIISYIQLSLMALTLLRPSYMLWAAAVQLAIAAVWTFLCQKVYQRLFPPRKLLLIYGERPIQDIMGKFASRPDKYDIVKSMNLTEGLPAIYDEITAGYGGIVLWDIPTSVRNDLLKYCYSKYIRVYLMPKISDVIIRGADPIHLFDTPIFLTREYSMTIEQRMVKRLIDVVCSLILIVLASPFMLITALAVKLYDCGPVLYKQVRCTTGGKEFKILKFRSMRVDAEKDGVARLASQNDSRITPVGKFIRKVRLDELPQLFNILKGDMSFIGPRPERPEIIKQYMEDMPEFAFRMKMKAGLAGYAQVYGKYNTTPYDKLKLDLFYIENYTVWLDLKLMLLTLKILFKPESTEGIDEKQTTALKK